MSEIAIKAALSKFACKISEWKDEHHDCDCPPHDGCGCHELRAIIQEMEYFGFTEEDGKLMLSDAPAAPSPGPYEAKFCKGMPADCCDYGVVSLATGREVCRVWTEADARRITALLAST